MFSVDDRKIYILWNGQDSIMAIDLNYQDAVERAINYLKSHDNYTEKPINLPGKISRMWPVKDWFETVLDPMKKHIIMIFHVEWRVTHTDNGREKTQNFKAKHTVTFDINDARWKELKPS